MTLFDLIKTEEQPKRVKLLTSKQACIILRCAPATLTKWRRRGYMSYLKGGTRYYYKMHEIEAVARWRFNGRMEKITKRMRKSKTEEMK